MFATQLDELLLQDVNRKLDEWLELFIVLALSLTNWVYDFRHIKVHHYATGCNTGFHRTSVCTVNPTFTQFKENNFPDSFQLP